MKRSRDGSGAVVQVRREGTRLYLSFPYLPWLVEWVREFPYAQFDREERTWSAMWCAQAFQLLSEGYRDGFLTSDPAELVEDGERLQRAPRALVWGKDETGGFVIKQQGYDQDTWELLRTVGGATWHKTHWVMPAHALMSLRGFVRRRVLQDPKALLTPPNTTVVFSPDYGEFTVVGPDERADDAFHRYFPQQDVVARWRERGLVVDFADDFSREVYQGEVARHGELPDVGLKLPLFEYQRRNVAVALERKGFAIVDEPGLGKTPQAIAVGETLLQREQVSRVVVIAPAGARTQWQQEICRFTGSDISDVVVVDGDESSRHDAYRRALTSRWVVAHYDVLSRDLEALRPVFEGALVVADEAHRLKNYASARTKAACELSRGAVRRLALTGTPLEKDVMEWFTVLSEFTIPGLFGSAKGFKGEYQLTSSTGESVGSQNIGDLRQRSRWHFGRHTKAQVAQHLPPLMVQRVVLDVPLPYRRALKLAHKEAAAAIRQHVPAFSYRPGAYGAEQATLFGGAFPPPAVADAQAVMQLRRLCASPRLVAGAVSKSADALLQADLIPDDDGPKLDMLREFAAQFLERRNERLAAHKPGQEVAPEDVQDERFVVFSHSRDMAELIAERFREDGVPYVLFTGAQSTQEREVARARFNDPNSDVVAFIATDAAAEALNLGRCCSTLIQFDPPWIPGLAQQRMNRIHRVDGTAARYQVINLMLANTIEEGMFQLLGSRADLQDALLGEEGSRHRVVGRRVSPRDAMV